MQDRWCVEAEIDSDVCRCWSYFFFFFFTSVWPEAWTSSWPCCHCWTKTANWSLLRGLRIPAVHLDCIGVQFSQQNAVMKCLFVRCCFVGHVRVVLCCFWLLRVSSSFSMGERAEAERRRYWKRNLLLCSCRKILVCFHARLPADLSEVIFFITSTTACSFYVGYIHV